ncbi:MAG: transporter substrate-binding domain-containing protein [Slackia sp.]|nr:transporter substrate-binding domain-containing protein [Slackia sp.]
MKHRVSLVGAFACAVCLALALVGCSQTPAYTPETLNPTISSPTIGKEGTLRVGVGGGAPFVVSSSDGTSSGLDIDIAAAIANQLGLKLEVVSLGSGASEVDVEAALTKGDVDIVMSATSSDANGNVWVSQPYTQTGVALFAAEGTKVPSRDAAPKIAAQSSSTSAWAVTNAFGDDALVAKADLLSALSAVEKKDSQYVAADAVIGTYAALGQNVDVQPIAMLGSIGGYGIAVSADNTDLQKAVSDALSAASGNGVVATICTKWLGAALDLSALPGIEVSSSAAPGAKTAGDEAASDASGESEEISDDQVAPKEEAGSNAVLPSGDVAAGAPTASMGMNETGGMAA